MLRHIALGALAASAVTTKTGRTLLANAAKVGVRVAENKLKTMYNIDVKELLAKPVEVKTDDVKDGK